MSVKRVYLSDSVANEIREYINDRQLPSGEKLPTVFEWMKLLGVGRSTLREGLKGLEAEGIIEVRNGRGIFVKERKPIRIHTSFQVFDETKHLLEVLEVRTALEARAVQLAVENGTEVQIADMEIYLAKYLEYRKAEEFQMASEADSNFHRTIYKASGNNILYEIITTLHEELYVLWDTPYGKEQLYDEGYPYHVELLEGLKQKDKNKSLTAFYNLIDSVRRNIIKLGEESG